MISDEERKMNSARITRLLDVKNERALKERCDQQVTTGILHIFPARY